MINDLDKQTPAHFGKALPRLHSSGVYSALFQAENPMEMLNGESDPFIRSLALKRHANDFFEATVEKLGTDDRAVRDMLEHVNHVHAVEEFNAALAERALRDGYRPRTAEEIIHHEYAGNIFTALFKSAPRKELLDSLRYGRNTYRASAWEHRRYGMWRSIADFLEVCKKYPVMSAGVIGGVAYLGHRYPFLGGVSGIAIIGWGGVVSALNEIRAWRIPGMNARKAEHYQNSGENMAAVLITAIGLKGIRQGTINGKEVALKTYGDLPTATVAQKVKAGTKSTFAAIKAEPGQHHKTNLFESFLFVSGLFDNVLLPFNWLAEKLKNR